MVPWAHRKVSFPYSVINIIILKKSQPPFCYPLPNKFGLKEKKKINSCTPEQLIPLCYFNERKTLFSFVLSTDIIHTLISLKHTYTPKQLLSSLMGFGFSFFLWIFINKTTKPVYLKAGQKARRTADCDYSSCSSTNFA